MTVSTTNVSVEYAGNDATTAFPITFQFGTDADIQAYLVNDADDSEVFQILGTNYTVAKSASGTGTLTMLVPPATGYTLRIDRQTVLTQPDSLRNQGAYYPETIEGIADRLTRKMQEVDLRSGGPQGPAGTPGSSDAATIAFLQSGTGAVARTIQDKAREWITPYDFGAVGDGVADDTAAVQAFFDYLRDNRVKQSACAGTFLLSAKLLWGTAAVEFATKNTHFDCEFITNYTSTAEAIRIAGYHDAGPTGRIRLTCGTSVYTDRRQWDGIVIETTSRPNFEMEIHVEGVKRWGVRNIGAGSLGRISHLNLKYCGSGRSTGVRIEPSAFSSNTKTGSSNSTAQRSLLGGVTVPSELLVDDFVIIGGQAFRVMAVDQGAGTVQVFPWVIPAASTMTFAIGGGLSEEGANANIWQYGTVITSLGGCGLRWNCTNPGNISAFHSASNVIAVSAGRLLNAACVGGSISECYIEGASHDIEYLEATIADTSLVLNTTGGFNIANIQKSQANDGATYTSAGYGVRAEVRVSGRPLRYNNPPKNGGSASQTLTLGTPKRQIYANSPTITLADASNVDSALGINAIEWACYGTGANGQPSGTVTVTAGSGTTVNGAASITFSGLVSPPQFKAYRKDGATPNWIVSLVNPNTGTASTSIGNTGKTLTPGVSEDVHIWTAPLTIDRAVTLSTTGVATGHRFRVVRSMASTGIASKLNVGTGPLASLAPGEFCDVVYTGAAWELAAKGSDNIRASGTWDPASIAAAGTTTQTFTVTGAITGDFVTGLSFDRTLAGLVATAYVSATDTVTVVLFNPTAGAIDLASSTVRFLLQKA